MLPAKRAVAAGAKDPLHASQISLPAYDSIFELLIPLGTLHIYFGGGGMTNLLMFYLDASCVLDVCCNVGGAAVAVVKHGVMWVGLEENKKMCDNIPHYVVQSLLKVARSYGYFKSRMSNQGNS